MRIGDPVWAANCWTAVFVVTGGAVGSFGNDVYGAGGGPGVAAGSAGTLPQLQPGLRITAAEFAVGLGIKVDFVAFMR